MFKGHLNNLHSCVGNTKWSFSGLSAKAFWLHSARHKIANALRHTFILASLSDLTPTGTETWCRCICYLANVATFRSLNKLDKNKLDKQITFENLFTFVLWEKVCIWFCMWMLFAQHDGDTWTRKRLCLPWLFVLEVRSSYKISPKRCTIFKLKKKQYTC